MLLNLDTDALRLNIDTKGQSQEKGMSFSSPVFVFLGFFNAKNRK